MLKVRLKKEALEVAIIRRNLSQNRLAMDLHISPSYFSQIVRGERAISAYMRQRLLDYFEGSKFDDLFVIEPDGQRDGKPDERA